MIPNFRLQKAADLYRKTFFAMTKTGIFRLIAQKRSPISAPHKICLPGLDPGSLANP